jgi:hypothetical protein
MNEKPSSSSPAVFAPPSLTPTPPPQQQQQQQASTSKPKLTPKSILKRKIRVRAPQDLNEGYEFSTTIKDGTVIKSTIPKGGVKKGDIISIPYIPNSNSVETSRSS